MYIMLSLFLAGLNHPNNLLSENVYLSNIHMPTAINNWECNISDNYVNIVHLSATL